MNKKTILITGGTGSLGKALTVKIFNNYPNVKKVIVFSRDEQKHFQMIQNVFLCVENLEYCSNTDTSNKKKLKIF